MLLVDHFDVEVDDAVCEITRLHAGCLVDHLDQELSVQDLIVEVVVEP